VTPVSEGNRRPAASRTRPPDRVAVRGAMPTSGPARVLSGSNSGPSAPGDYWFVSPAAGAAAAASPTEAARRSRSTWPSRAHLRRARVIQQSVGRAGTIAGRPHEQCGCRHALCGDVGTVDRVRCASATTVVAAAARSRRQCRSGRPGQERRSWRPARPLAREGGRRMVSPVDAPSSDASSGGCAGRAAPAPPGEVPVCRRSARKGFSSARSIRLAWWSTGPRRGPGG
jgi:hypothetical protein